nr:FH2 domain-containing protein 1 [Nothobranchius furzeri]
MHVMGSISPANDSEGFSFLKEDVAVSKAMSPPFSHISENGTRSPVAPPPPPPPPPPPLGLRDSTCLKKRRVRSFFWKTIPEEQVKGRTNLWTQGQVQQHFQIDVQEVEELFGHNDCQSDAKAPPTRGGKGRVSFRETKEVSILDPKRGLNVAIFLKQFKRSNQTLVADIQRGSSESFGAEPLRDLLKLLPEKDEVKKLKAYRGDISKLSLADSFVYLLIQVPSYSLRIESLLLKQEFPAACEAMKHHFGILHSATKELMCCEELHAVLHLVLQAGNILNAGGSAGNAVGFKLSSLLSLADTKSNKPGMNLLHFVALEAQKKDEKLLEFPLRLKNVQAASRISMETLDAELQSLTLRTRSVEDSIQEDAELLQQLGGFLQSAAASLCSLRDGRQQLKRDGSELLDFFCEDRETFRLDDCFSIFHTFCCRFTSAVRENQDREAREAARRRRLQEEEVKRHSWAGGEQVRGAFGSRCRSETDMSSIISKDDSGLLGALLAPKFHLSPRRRSWNPQRSRNPPCSSVAAAAERELSSFLEISGDLRVPWQRNPAWTTRLSPEKVSAFSQVDPKTTSAPPETSSNRTDSSHISGAQTRSESVDIEDKDKSTSHLELQADHNNNHRPSLQDLLLHQTSSCLSRRSDDHMPVVPELEAFSRTSSETARNQVKLPSALDRMGTNHLDHLKNVPQDVRRPSSPQREEEQVIVWCVTGVCEAAGEHTHTGTRQEENRQGSPTLLGSSEPQPDRDKSEPISSQPASRCSDSSLLASPPGRRPPEPKSPGPEPGLTAEEKEPRSEEVSKPEPDPRPTTGEASAERETKPAASSNQNQTSGIKPATPNRTGTSSRSVRSLTRSENQSMRRIVPITRSIRGALSVTKRPKEPAAASRTSSRTSTLTSSNLNGALVRRGERSATAPSSQRPKEPSASREQNQDPERRPSIRKASMKSRTQTEEKMCLSRLRSLTQEGGGGSVSAPVTPLRKNQPSSTPPGFTRNTASSSFRRTRTTSGSSPLPNTGSPKTSSSSPPTSTLSRTGSLRVASSSRSSSPLMTQKIQSPPGPSLPGSSKDLQQNISRSPHLREASRPTRPIWR